jgi:putative methyltransferase (TIGR04325 family)
MIKKIIKELMPPILLKVLKPRKKNKVQQSASIIWEGNYPSWQEALTVSDGYDKALILEKVKNAILKVKNGEAVYERDSVLFDKIQYSWGLMAGLQKAAIDNNNKLSIIDFGGSLGSSYFQSRDFLMGLNKLEWSVIEQPHFVDCGNNEIADNQLCFYHTIHDCLKERNPNVLLLSGVLQCIENPYEWIRTFIDHDFEYIIIDRTAFTNAEIDVLTVQVVPEFIYKASYPAWFLNKGKVLEAFNGYTNIGEFNSFCDKDIVLNQTEIGSWKGILLKKVV